MNKINIKNDWHLHEKPKAYTWDQESSEFFKRLDLEVILKPSSYTSVHYVIRPKPFSRICCEIQVRTLFEEVWGEVDHVLNYPNETSIVACREQLRVLAKIAGAGTRLVDSIFRSIPEKISDINNINLEHKSKSTVEINTVTNESYQAVAPAVIATSD